MANFKKSKVTPTGFLRFQNACESMYFEYFGKKRPFLLHRLNVAPGMISHVKSFRLGRTDCQDTPQYLEYLRNRIIAKYSSWIHKKHKKSATFKENMVGVDSAVSEEQYCAYLHVKTPSNQHVDYLLEDRIFEVDLTTLLYSGKIQSQLQLRSGKIINIHKEAWVNGELEYKHFQESARLIVETDECTKIYDGDILLAQDELYSACRDIMKKYADNLGKMESSRGDYLSPYLKMLLRAINEHAISEENQPPNKVLIPWFEEHLKTELADPNPQNKAKMMATLVRLPESQKGGLRKTKVNG